MTRSVRWDSDHVVLFDDETREIAKEIVRNGADRVLLALDFFDASINRVSAWAVGFRSWQKALLSALCTPNAALRKLQDENRMTELMAEQEGITEQLKAENQMEWVGLMNNARKRAEDIIDNKLIYT